ncbi:hypothetical protein ERD78_18635 [Allopusillimonas soli]|uniref:Uncharacterized protein n=1 Tax=Allopusillimonas soli TaxID=659016 RepID=A0A853FGB1_9BURK|nr:hypothetical protein [Allopusillimonas soli]NYT38917.1 hypothetical protein [Allopusillimonas soli]TEA70086.1 hypothetical protein ERD78_18635 [Allopusillimonas soli]
MTTNNIPSRWYVVGRRGMATLCQNEADAKNLVDEYDNCWPNDAPHVAVQLAPVQSAMPADEWLKEHERLVLAYKDAVFDTTGFFLDNRRAAFDSVMAHARRRIEGERK